MANPYVFIVGCPRSGTTLLQRLVNAHSDIAVMPEAHWIRRLLDEREGLTPEDVVTPEVISYLLAQSQFVGLHLEQDKLDALLGDHQPVLLADFVASIFDQFGKIHGKALVGNKTPGLVRRLRDFHTAWPKARFVHLIRDGRDVYLSTLHRHLKRPKAGVFDTWAEDPAATAALWWELNVRSGRQAGNPLGPELYYEIRYESLVAKPEEECKALCEFLAVRYEDAMLRFHEGQTRRRAARPITPGLRDWRSQMAAEDAERFEAAAGDLLDELGYTRACKWPSPDAAQQAARIRAAFEQRCAPGDDCRSLGRAKAATLLGSEGT